MALLENSNRRLHWFRFWQLGGTTSISSKFTIRWRHHLVTKFVPNSSYRSNAWVRCASGNVLSARVTPVKFYKRHSVCFKQTRHMDRTRRPGSDKKEEKEEKENKEKKEE